MKKLLSVAMLVIGFGLCSGCASSALRSRAWEYKVVALAADFEKRQDAFNELGKDGWVFLYAGPDGAHYFVRPKK